VKPENYCNVRHHLGFVVYQIQLTTNVNEGTGVNNKTISQSVLAD